jgi:hypothetical protein
MSDLVGVFLIDIVLDSDSTELGEILRRDLHKIGYCRLSSVSGLIKN